MSFNTIIQQGRFTQAAAAVDVQLEIRSDVDWIKVYNESAIIAAGGESAIFYYQRGMTAGRGIVQTQAGAITQIGANSGFTLIDTSSRNILAGTTVTDINGATPPRVTAAAHGLQTGDMVRLYSITGGAQLGGGIEYYITRTGANTFDLQYMPAVAAAAAPGASALVRRVEFDYAYFPRRRFITKVRQDPARASEATVTLSYTHGYSAGEEIRFFVPSEFGMVQLDGLLGTIKRTGVADVDGETNTINVDIDVSTFTAFAFPVTADAPFSFAQVIPVGMDTAEAISLGNNILSDATDNQSFIGVNLAAGTDSPGGDNNDVMYWIAGKSFSVDNQ